MRPRLVIGNWKMNGSRADNSSLVEGLLQQLGDSIQSDVAVCPPLAYLQQVGDMVKDSAIQLGAQNLADELQGAFTGEVSAPMLVDLNCRYVLVGHSERRALYGETDTLVGKKAAIALTEGLTPVICVGETLEQRRDGRVFDVIEQQMAAVIDAVGVDALARTVVAYEPVWAIGTGETATPAQAQEVHAMIRQYVAERNESVAQALQILYGGSVKADNAAALFTAADIDGALVGGASLKADDFAAICKAG